MSGSQPAQLASLDAKAMSVNDPARYERRQQAARQREIFADIVAAPAFDPVVVAHDTLFAARFLPNPALDTAFREAWRFQIVTVAIHLHDTRIPGDPRSGLTVGRLQAILAGRSLASAGRIAAILKQLEAAGHLTAQPSTADRRIVILSPTQSLLDAVALWERVMFTLIDLAGPETGPGDDFVALSKTLPHLGSRMRYHMVEARLAGWSPLDGFPEIAMFATRDGGWRLLSRMAAMRLSAQHGDASTPLDIDLQAFARETGTSRSSVRRLLEDAWDAALLNAPPRNGRNILPSLALVASFSAWLAMFIDAHRQFAMTALDELRAKATKSPAEPGGPAGL